MAKLKGWKNKLIDALDNYLTTDIDSDHPNCPRCNCAMDFYGHDDNGDFPVGEGYWKCKECGFDISEDELNSSRW